MPAAFSPLKYPKLVKQDFYQIMISQQVLNKKNFNKSIVKAENNNSTTNPAKIILYLPQSLKTPPFFSTSTYCGRFVFHRSSRFRSGRCFKRLCISGDGAPFLGLWPNQPPSPAAYLEDHPRNLAKLLYFTNLGFPEIRGFP